MYFALLKIAGEFGNHFEGDMILSEDQIDEIVSPERNGLISKNARWPNNVVRYQLSPNHTKQQHNIIENALKQIEKVSCIKFLPRTNQNAYVEIIVSLRFVSLFM